ncbi:MAG: LysR family transcriptional regulator [Spirochaetes bacterium]|nr:LysR family transcriptional regulator [Spirochaetota bacterium]
MNLYHLKTFYYTAKCRSLTKAADILCITQPAVTKQIKLLQSYYDLKFIDVIGKKVILTDAGEHLYAIADKIFDMEIQAEESIKDFQDSSRGRISILSCESFGAYYLPYIISNYNKSNRNINISVIIRHNESIVSNTVELNNDIGFVSKPIHNPKISVQEILEDNIVCVVPYNYPLRRKDCLEVADIDGCNLIVHEKDSVTRKMTEAFIKKNNLNVNIHYEVSNNEAIKRLVEQGLGISFMSSYIVSEELKTGRLIALPVEDENFNRKYYMIHHVDKYFPKPLKDFMDLVRQWSDIY